MSKRTEKAASLLRRAVKMLEDGPDYADRALQLAKQAVSELEGAGADDDDDSDEPSGAGFPLRTKAAAVSTLTRATRSTDPALRREAQALLERVDPERAEQRRLMGLSASTHQPISVKNNKFVFSADALAKSRVRA